MMDTHLVKAVFAVPDASFNVVHLGDRQSVALTAISLLEGVVTSISPQADPGDASSWSKSPSIIPARKFDLA